MGGIAGISFSDGRPVDARILETMAEAMSPRGPNGRQVHFEDGLGLLCLELHTTPEAHAEKQPLIDPGERFVLLWDGRLDHRVELARALRQHSRAPRRDTDAELFLQSWLLWGESCVERIRGDFAVCVWDRTDRRWFCARDPAGVRPLYYHWSPVSFAFATEIAAALTAPGVSSEVNEGMVAEYLTDSLRSVDETLFSAVRRLPPGHRMTIREGRSPQIEAYYNLLELLEAPPEPVSGRVERFLELFAQSVRSRLRADGGVAFDLSGGLDSTAVVAMAAQLRVDGSWPWVALETFSLVFPGEACDESQFIDQAEQAFGCRGHRTVPEPLPLEIWRKIARESRLPPPPPNSSLITRWRSGMAQMGFKVLMTGVGGDECFVPWDKGSGFPQTSGVRRALAAWKALPGRMKAESPGRALREHFRLGVWPLVPAGLREAIRDWRRRRPANWPWLEPAFVRRSGLPDRIQALPPCGLDPWSVAALELEDLHRRWLHLELRSPFLDRDLREFCLSLPSSNRDEGADTKILLREALARTPRFPAEIRKRRDKAEFSALFRRTWELHGVATVAEGEETLSGRVRPGQIETWISAISQKKLSILVNYLWTAWHGYAISLGLTVSHGCLAGEREPTPAHVRSDEQQEDLSEA